jgi:hypothetical protein
LILLIRVKSTTALDVPDDLVDNAREHAQANAGTGVSRRRPLWAVGIFSGLAFELCSFG